MTCASCSRPDATICKARAFIGQFDRHPEERMRVQMAAIELARHNLDKNGDPLPLDERQEEVKVDVETVLAFADAFRPMWNKGLRCPNDISKRVVNVIQGIKIY